MNKNFLCSWSGGKDSCFAYMQAVQQGYAPKVLLNVLNEEGKISRSHGIPSNILKQQASALGLPIKLINSSWDNYETNFTQALLQLTNNYNISHAVFGDIDLQPHKDWEEKVCTNAGIKAILPLWQQDRRNLVTQMLQQGIETIIVSCNEKMGEAFLGKKLTIELIDELAMLDIDVCGENGEFHTLVTNCALFANKINVQLLQKVKHGHYWFQTLQ